ncbi:ATP-binding protein [Tellurirhabdus rosea]|uniref:ATP-binding protein n=1 Tax=Tellurirhabdus rosea TaxID=2674997 RepID=UPI00225B928D|nr:AAA family ATPase [Tellurirhabdus rosea]
MYSPSDLENLRAASQLSPDNVLLRKLLADALLKTGRAAEAETEYRAALRLAPDDTALKLGLARAFQQNGKTDAALVVLEDLIQQNNAEAYLLSARLLLAQRQFAEARDHYQRACLLDDRLADPALEAELAVETDRIPLAAGPEETGEFRLESQKPTISFADVGGMDAVKEEIALKIIFPLKHPDLYKSYGKRTGGGILLYGPPGCGKTYLARATAGEISASFISVGLNDILDMWIGASERNLHDVFEQARRQAPCVLFFDEVDALGASRNDMRKTAGRTVINQFLDELDGVRHANDGVLVLAATNTPWYLDSAFRRPGRFDRLIFVAPPDASAREEILRLQLRELPAADVDVTAVARKTETFSGADLQAVVDRAVERKLLEAMKAGRPVPVTTADLLDAVKAHRPTVREWFSSAKNYALYANEAGQYEPVLSFMKTQKWL